MAIFSPQHSSSRSHSNPIQGLFLRTFSSVDSIRKNGFTLVELLVVVAILGILSGIVLYSVSATHTKSRDAQRFKDLETIQAAVEQYYTDQGHYPILTPRGSIATASFAAALQSTLPTLPKDPSGGATYLYQSDAGGNNYCLVFTAPEVLADFPPQFVSVSAGVVFYGTGPYVSGC